MGEGTYGLEGGYVTRRGGDVVDEDTTIGLCAELVVELEATRSQYQVRLLARELGSTYGLPFCGTRLKVPFLALKYRFAVQ